MSGVSDAAQAKQFWLRQNGESLSRLKAIRDVLPDLTNSVDENGSPVTVDPVDWYICFVPGLRRQWWHRFTHPKHKHVFAMRPTSTGSWLLVEPWWTRMMVTILPPTDAVKFLQWAAQGDILRVREAIPGQASQLRGWSNCAVLAAFLLGRSSWAWTPHGFYRELLREKTTRHVNVEQLLADQFAMVVNQYSSNALSICADQLSLPLQETRGFLQAVSEQPPARAHTSVAPRPSHNSITGRHSHWCAGNSRGVKSAATEAVT